MEKNTSHNPVRRPPATQTLIFGAVLTALVIVLQSIAEITSVFLPITISLALIPIVIGATVGGVKLSTWLGFVSGVVILLMPSTATFFGVHFFGTILTVLVKGIAAGLAAGFVYRLFEKKNQYLAVILAAIVCPVVNTGVFVLGCFAFFYETIAGWAAVNEEFTNAISYLFLGMIGLNFIVELISNILLSPAAVRLLNVLKKQSNPRK